MKQCKKMATFLTGCIIAGTSLTMPVYADKIYINHTELPETLSDTVDDLENRFVYEENDDTGYLTKNDGSIDERFTNLKVYNFILCDEYREKAEEFIASGDRDGLYYFLSTEVYAYHKYMNPRKTTVNLTPELKNLVEADDYDGICEFFKKEQVNAVPAYPYEIGTRYSDKDDETSDVFETLGVIVCGNFSTIPYDQAQFFREIARKDVSMYMDVFNPIGQILGNGRYAMTGGADLSDSAYETLVKYYVRGESIPYVSVNFTTSTTNNLYGDVNVDGTISLTDAVVMQKRFLKGNSWDTYEEIMNADCNRDDVLDYKDYSILMAYICERIDTLPYYGEVGSNGLT